MSTPYFFPDPLFSKIPWALRLASPIIPMQGKNEGHWFTPGLVENHISYSHNPVRSAYELAMLLKQLRRRSASSKSTSAGDPLEE